MLIAFSDDSRKCAFSKLPHFQLSDLYGENEVILKMRWKCAFSAVVRKGYYINSILFFVIVGTCYVIKMGWRSPILYNSWLEAFYALDISFSEKICLEVVHTFFLIKFEHDKLEILRLFCTFLTSTTILVRKKLYWNDFLFFFLESAFNFF